jgi:hypothetical protein
MGKDFASSLPAASEFIEFARASKAINLEVSAGTLLEASENILRSRPGYVLFNIRCGMLIIDRELLEVDVVRNVAGMVRAIEGQ